MRTRTHLRLRIATHIAGLAPFVWLVWAYLARRLGPDPIGEATRRSGRYALVFLFLSLLPTAVRILTGYGGLMRVRRALGTYAFKYALVHLLTYVGLDFAFDWGLILSTIRDSRFVLVGLAAFVILLALAVTSTDGAVRLLRKNWRRLHRLAYLAGVLVIVHFAWAHKELRAWPLAAGVLMAVLLVFRLPPVARGMRRLREG